MNNFLDSWTNIGFPIIILVLVTVMFSWYIRQVQKDKISLTKTFFWIIFSIIFWILGLYMLIISMLRIFGYTPYNIVDKLITGIGLDYSDGRNWFTIVILLLITILYSRVFKTTIKIASLEKRVDELNREVAIINGKVNKTVEFRMAKIARPHKTLKESKKELIDQVKFEKIKLATEAKLIKVQERKTKMTTQIVKSPNQKKDKKKK